MRREWQLRLYESLGVLMLAAGVAGIARLWPAIGRGFGGFIWQYDNHAGHTVSFDVPRHWPGPAAGLVPHTRITAIEGRSPFEFADVYASKPIGAPIIYEIVKQQGEAGMIRVPLTRFTLTQLAEGYGVVFLVGTTFSTAGYVLLRSANDTGRALLGYIMLACANMGFYHSHNGNIDRFYDRPIFAAVMGAPANGVLGALLIHLALVYPRKLLLHTRLPWLAPLGYATGLSLGTVFGLSLYFGKDPRFARLQPPTQAASIAFLALGVAATLIRGAWELLADHDDRSATERRQTQIMAVAWTCAAVVLLGSLGAANLPVPMPFDAFMTLAAVLPIGLAYAIFNADLIADLEEQSQLRSQLLIQLDDLKRLRERMLDDLADELHDSALADSKAIEMRLYALLRQTTEGRIDGNVLRNSLAELHQQGIALGQSLRLTVEGVKPVDFTQETLFIALSKVIAQLNDAHLTHYTLEWSDSIDIIPASVKEAIYWITKAALNNVRDHAKATQCIVTFKYRDTNLLLQISDNGAQGIISKTIVGAMPRRHLGIPAMRSRAARFGGQFEIDTTPHGTTVIVSIPIDLLRNAV